MTMFRDLTMLDYKKCPVTAAEGIEKEWEWQGTLVSIGAVGNRAWWESGYEAGLKNVTNKPRLLEQLREYEQVVMGLQVTVMAQQSTIAENDKRIASLERERTAVRESLGNLYIPILEVGTDADTGESFYLGQGAHLAMEALQDAHKEITGLEGEVNAWHEICRNIHEIYQKALRTTSRPLTVDMVQEMANGIEQLGAAVNTWADSIIAVNDAIQGDVLSAVEASQDEQDVAERDLFAAVGREYQFPYGRKSL